MSKRAVFLILLFSVGTSIFSQTYYKFAVYFADKSPVGYPYSLSAPEVFLSQKSIDRRTANSINFVTLDLPVAPSYIQGVLAISDSIQLFNTSKWLNCIVVGTSDSTLADSINTLSYVTQVKWIFKGAKQQTAFDATIPQGPPVSLSGAGYGIDYGKADTQSTMLGLDYLHKKNYHGKDITIAVFDAGFTNTSVISGFNHLRDSVRILGTYDFIANEESVEGDGTHGTNVLSCIGGYIPNEFMGTAPQANYWLLRTEEGAAETTSEEYAWLVAAEFADSAGVDIINSSLGYTTFDFPAMDYTYADMNGNTTIVTQAADLAARTGMIVCNSAGNSGTNSWYYIGAPADADSILAVGAVKSNRANASFSSYGPSADGRIKPDVSTMGQQALTIGAIGYVQKSNGTSFSSPILSGAVACLWQKHSDKSNMEIIRVVKLSAHLSSTPTAQYGYGIPNFGVADRILEDQDFVTYYTDQPFTVYPNPVLGSSISFDFYSNTTQQVYLVIADVTGHVVHEQAIFMYEKSLQTYTIPLNKELARGVYALHLFTQQKNFYTKILSQQ